MDADVIITLLTVVVTLLSAVIIGLLIAVIIVLVKVRQMAKKLTLVFANVGKATDWLSPAKVFYQARQIFHK
jgi:MFS superfamily sulfate permease-like transporter